MATQTDIQQLIQGLSPGAANNGNPNTIWNTSGTVQQPIAGQPFVAFAGNNPLASALPPMHNAAGGWFTNPLSPAATLGPLTIPAASGQLPPVKGAAQLGGPWQAPTPALQPNLARWTVPNFPTLPPGTPGVPPPTGTPVVMPPLGGPLPPDPVAGGGGGAAGATGGGVEDPMIDPVTGMTAFGSGGPYNQSFSIYDPRFASIIGTPQGKVYEDTITNQTSNFFSTLGQTDKDKLWGLKDAQGNFDWKQAIDMITEPWFQTNMYLAGLNEWDTSNILTGLAQAITGLPVSQIMDYFGQQQALQSDPQNWLEKQLVDHYMDNLRNDFANNPDAVVAKLTQQAANTNDPAKKQAIQNLINQLQSQAQQAALLAQVFGGGDCVVVESVLEDYDRASRVEIDDEMSVRDPVTGERSTGFVSYSETKTVPCVRITTNHGVVLECSRTAPIADIDGNQVLAPELEGKLVPVMINNVFVHDIVTTVEDIGDREVQHITVENNFFLAGKVKGKYMFHHNKKADPFGYTPPSGGGAGPSGQSFGTWGGNFSSGTNATGGSSWSMDNFGSESPFNGGLTGNFGGW